MGLKVGDVVDWDITIDKGKYQSNTLLQHYQRILIQLIN